MLDWFYSSNLQSPSTDYSLIVNSCHSLLWHGVVWLLLKMKLWFFSVIMLIQVVQGIKWKEGKEVKQKYNRKHNKVAKTQLLLISEIT